MEIDGQIEPLVREALTAVVKEDSERLARALAAFPDDDAALNGARTAMALAAHVLHDQAGRPPTEEETRTVAQDIASAEAWTDVTAEEVVTFLLAALRGTRVDDDVPLERVLILAYVIAGYLISSYRQDDEDWWEYLDRAEAAIESAQG
jgi:hypothetical protein